MPRSPLIGLVGSRFIGSRLTGNLDVLGASPIEIFYSDYSQAVIEAGGLPVWVPLDVDPVEMVERLDGMVMTGGEDIDPKRYGQQPDVALGEIVFDRDEYELAILDAVIDRGLPTLGVCRGLQMINVHAGGTLHQHVPEHVFVDAPADELTHEIACVEGSVVAGLFGPKHRVNSLHHQATDEVGDHLWVTATAPDGGIEALEHRSLPMVSVQWHPEMLPTRPTDPLFRWLVDTARR